MSKAFIISATKIVDGQGSHKKCNELVDSLNYLGEDIIELNIDPLYIDWHSPIKKNHFRSGCGPIEALGEAKRLIKEGASAILIKGEDLLRTGYSRTERANKMGIYGKEYPLTTAYTDLSSRFIKKNNLTERKFKEIADILFNNYLKSYHSNPKEVSKLRSLIPEHRYKPITKLFRGIDCANPSVDFSGNVLIVKEELLEKLAVPIQQCVEISSVGLGTSAGDGKDHIDEISDYSHLKHAYDKCCSEIEIDVKELLRKRDIILEIYTCFPIVPLAFLSVTGLIKSLEAIPEFLEKHNITITGGMNLARAPWNNPALNGIISVYDGLIKGSEQYGLVHGNGGLGYKQGVALLTTNISDPILTEYKVNSGT